MSSGDSTERPALLQPFDPPGPVKTYPILKSSLEKGWHDRGLRIWTTPQTQITLFDDPVERLDVIVKGVKRKNAARDKFQMLRRSFQNERGKGKDKMKFSTEQSIYREIAIMKSCRHPNHVRLLSVIDDPKKDNIYMTMEHCRGGRVVWQDEETQEPLLTVDQARRVFRDVVVGLDYLHYMGIIHRDIKPDNLVWTDDRHTVKIIDYGISYFNPTLRKVPFAKWRKSLAPLAEEELFPSNDLTKLRGTEYFIAPEIVGVSEWDEPAVGNASSASQRAFTSSNTIALGSVRESRPSSTSVGDNRSTPPLPSSSGHTVPPTTNRPPITKAIDIWSLAVTLYCLLFGTLPFNIDLLDGHHPHHARFKLYKVICTKDWAVSETMGADRVPTGGRYPNDEHSVIRLLDRMLQKDPRRRMTLHEIKRHPWVTADIPNPSEWIEDTSPAQFYRPLIYKIFRRFMRRTYSKCRALLSES